VVLLGLVLTRGYRDAGIGQALDQARAQAAVIEQMAVAPALTGANLSRGLTSGERRRLQSATDLAIFHGSVLRLRLLTFAGTVAFSDDGTVLGVVERRDPGFRAAADGKVTASVVRRDSRFGAATIRVLQPVVPEASGRAIGVLAVFLPYDEVAAKVQAQTRAAIVRLAGWLVGLYAVLAMISFWTTRALRRFAADHEHQALHDPLTGLPNRELFRRVAEQALADSRHDSGGALVLVDLDHFKEVNDTLGHHAGDELLRVVGRRLRAALSADDTVARLGGDEFGIIVRGEDRDGTVGLLNRVRRTLSDTVVLDGARLSVEASFGVCFFAGDVDSVELLLQRADAAMYEGKHGPVGVVVHEPTRARAGVDALVVQGELRRALDRDELTLYYQPKIQLATGRVTGVEALVRWRHPERGLLPPGAFLPVAERCELIQPLTRWVLARAVSDCADWSAAGFDWTVSVNVSARNLSSTDFATEVAQVLDEARLPATRLCLEVTETARAYDGRVARDVIDALAGHGIAMALDDFGAGYTAISQLRGLKMTEIKVDRLFVTGLAGNDQDRAIVRSVVDLSHSLGCTVTAEGVETAEVAFWLRRAGCDHAQGFLWLPPAPWRDVAAWSLEPVPATAMEATA
jgi:diguanylate cyclase (GGDEF)-like protein